MSKKTDLITQRIAPTIEAMGFEVVEVEIKKEGPNTVLYVYIHADGGVFIADCEKVSSEIDPIIEEMDPIEEAYYLCVSSPGADRPLKTEKDYARAMQTEVEVNLYRAVEGKKHIVGILNGYDSGAATVTIRTDDGPITLEQKDISRIRPYIRF